LIADSVIVPPAATVEEAQERLKKFKCFDWWFCYEEKKVPDECVRRARGFLKRAAEGMK